MRLLLQALAVVTAALFMQAPLAQAQDISAADQVEQRIALEMATDLLNYGQAKGDALAIVTAVNVMAGVSGGVAGADGEPLDLMGALAQAEELAAGNDAILSLAADVRATVEEAERGMCYWQYQCYWNGWCEYFWICF